MISTLQQNTITKGKGSFTYNYEPLTDKPVEVFYYAAHYPLEKCRIVVVIPGVKRDADAYRDYWIEIAEREKLLILSPHFPKSTYPAIRAYQLGNLFDENQQAIPEEQWAFTLVETLFEEVKVHTGITRSSYRLFGHSAGAQFVHRFMIFKPENRVKIAVAANAGWYTLPDLEVDYPYGLKGSHLTETKLASAFCKKLYVLLGNKDDDPGSPNLRHTPEADQQGIHRFERGLYFFEQSKAIAASQSLRIQWQLKVVSGVEHQPSEMSAAAAKLFFDK